MGGSPYQYLCRISDGRSNFDISKPTNCYIAVNDFLLMEIKQKLYQVKIKTLKMQ